MNNTVTQPDALLITTARADELQNWVNRGHVRIDVPNPGRGKSRRYICTDCVKLAVMVRLVRFGVESDRAAPFLAYVERRLSEEKPFKWDEFTTVSYRSLSRDNIRLGELFCADLEGTSLGMSSGDFGHLSVAAFSEWFRSLEGAIGGKRRRDAQERIIADRRDKLASLGAFAEPFMFFPLGEIVNGTIARFNHVVETGKG
jgi:hypothetical protein